MVDFHGCRLRIGIEEDYDEKRPRISVGSASCLMGDTLLRTWLDSKKRVAIGELTVRRSFRLISISRGWKRHR